MKKLIAILLASLMLLTFVGCGSKESSAPLNVMALKGPTGISICKLASDNAESGSDFNVSFAAAPDEITGKIISGECDVACVPTNLASVLYNKTKGEVKVCAVTTLGVLYLLDTSGEVNSVADLAGKEIGATGQGSNPEYILNKILSGNSLEGNVTVNYYAEHAELASMMIAGNVKTAMLPEPFVTQVMLKSEGTVNTINLQEEWGKLTDGVELAQGVIIVRSEVLKNNKSAVEKFLKDFAASSDFAVENIEETSAICEELGVIASAAVASKAIPRCNITYVDGENMKNSVSSFLEVLFESNPASVGGKLPEKDFYYVG